MGTKSFTDIQSLLSAVNQEMVQVMDEVSVEGGIIALRNAESFYSQGSPTDYVRTGKYGDAPTSDGVQMSGNTVSTEIYMEEAGHGYATGTFSAREVWQAAEDHTAGVLGKSGLWQDSEDEIKKWLMINLPNISNNIKHKKALITSSFFHVKERM